MKVIGEYSFRSRPSRVGSISLLNQPYLPKVTPEMVSIHEGCANLSCNRVYIRAYLDKADLKEKERKGMRGACLVSSSKLVDHSIPYKGIDSRQEGRARNVTDWKSLMKQEKWKVSVTPTVSTNFWFSYPIKLTFHKTF